MLLKATDITYSYPESDILLSFPDFELEEKQECLVLGKSGSGKTTLLHILAFLLPLQKGEVTFQKQKISQLSKKELAQLRAKYTGIIHQKPIFVKSLSCLDNIQLSNYFSKSPQNLKKLTANAEKLEVAHLLHKNPDQLSGGEQQRMTILRAISHGPKIIYADEPTSNLDDESCAKVYQLLSTICTQNESSLVIVTHDKRLIDLVPKKIVL